MKQLTNSDLTPIRHLYRNVLSMVPLFRYREISDEIRLKINLGIAIPQKIESKSFKY